ncbi:MAG: glycosyltransferase [Acidimicrobiia bacterium]
MSIQDGITNSDPTEISLAVALRDMRPCHFPESGPLVSIIVVTRDGAHHLERLFAGLESRTDYRTFEVIVVDNGSTDDTDEVVDRDWSFAVSTIRHDRNTSFAYANNEGIAAASGELVLFLNNDVEPISPQWLGAMVADLTERDDVAGVGALLVYPQRQTPVKGSFAHPNLTVQHAGVAFTLRRGAVRAANLYAGSDPLASDFTRTTAVPALTAACLLARTATVRQIGGFDTQYVYGSEDWDLSLALRENGLLVRSGAAALFHHEYGTQDLTPQPEKETNRRLNQAHFDQRWGPFVFRRLLRDRLEGGSVYGDGTRPRLWFALDARTSELDRRAIELLAAEFESRNWFVSLDEEQPDDLDVIIVASPSIELAPGGRHPIHVAWVIDRLSQWQHRPGMDRFDIVAAGDPLAADLLAVVLRTPVLFLPLGPSSSNDTEPSPSYEADLGVWSSNERQAKTVLDLLDNDPDLRVAFFGDGWESLTEVVDRWRGTPDLDSLAAVTSSVPMWLVPSDPTRVGPSPLVMDMIQSGAIPLTRSWDHAVALFGAPDLYVRDRHDLTHKRRHLPSGAANSGLDRSRHTASARVGSIVGALERHADALRVGIRICAPNREVSPNWGDTHFAEQFAAALRKQGVATGVHVASEWNSPQTQIYEVLLHLRGVKPMTPAAGAFNVLWIVSHPDDVTVEECEQFDLVLVASPTYADHLAGSIGVPVHTFLQAADSGIFAPSREVDPRYTHEVVFVGNARWPVRLAPRWMLENDVPFALYGANWEGFPEERRRMGDFVPNQELPALYRSAGIVVNDHWPDMARHGFLSNRIFDVLASGGFLVSDHVEGIAETFGGAVPTFGTADELIATLAMYRSDPDLRLRRTLAGMEIVRTHHTFDQRARQFLELLATHAEIRP